MDTLRLVDRSASIGDGARALKGLWADVAQTQTDKCLIEAIGIYLGLLKRPTVKLRRSFDQSDFKGGTIRYWRVISPGHRNNESDLSLAGLKQWGII